MNKLNLTKILGTDSISSSRIVINDNFKRLSDELENYQEYFNENGIYADSVVSMNGTIDFKIDDSSESIVTINENGIDTSNIEVGGNANINSDATVGGTLQVNNIKNVQNSSNEINTNKLLVETNTKIEGNLEVTGNLSVNGNYPSGGGGGGETTRMTMHPLDTISDELTRGVGYIDFYNNGNIIMLKDNDNNVINLDQWIKLVVSGDPEQIMQYAYKPIIITGKNINIKIERTTQFFSNGRVVRSGNTIRLVPLNQPDTSSYRYSIKMSPVLVDHSGRKSCWMNIELYAIDDR